MSEQMILTVLNEVLEELKEANKSLKGLNGKVTNLEERVQAFEQKEIRIDPPDLEAINKNMALLPDSIKTEMVNAEEHLRQRITTECGQLRAEMSTGLAKIAATVETQPKPIVRRISFFPENDQHGNYKTFIRWLIGGTICGMIILTAYVLEHEWILHQPREWPTVATGMMMPAEDSVKPPPPANRTGTTAKPRGSKKIRKKVDTLKNNTIRDISDSSMRN
jgi:hypothetical protein